MCIFMLGKVNIPCCVSLKCGYCLYIYVDIYIHMEIISIIKICIYFHDDDDHGN